MRKITIYLRDYVDDSRRRERRRGTIVAIGAVLATLFAAGAFGPAVTEKEAEVTDTTDTSTTIATAPAKLSATPDGFDFNRQLPGSRSDPRPVTVRNDGDDPLSIKVNLEGAGFDWTSNCTAPLARGETCSVAVTFAPQSPGLLTAKLIIDSNGGTAVITLNGFALRNPPSDLGTIDFGRQSVNTHVPPRTVVFTNTNALPVALATPTIIPDKSPFGVIGEPCGVVPSSGGCKVSIAFTPRLGESTAELRIFDANQNLVAIGQLTGSGYRQLQVNPALIQQPTKKP